MPNATAIRSITVPYIGNDLQLLVLLPDAKDGLAALEAKLTPEILAGCANPGTAELHPLPAQVQDRTAVASSWARCCAHWAWRAPSTNRIGSANFDRMAPRKPDDYLCISEVFHKTFLALDEKGTEAAAATAVVMIDERPAMIEKPKPIEVRVDRPFLFAIQHRPSGACLFLGRVTDPRLDSHATAPIILIRRPRQAQHGGK